MEFYVAHCASIIPPDQATDDRPASDTRNPRVRLDGLRSVAS